MAKTTVAKTKEIKFEIKGKEHELKLTWDSVKRLHAMQEGGALGLVGKALMGDDDTYSNVIYTGLLHTGEGYTLEEVNAAIEESFQNGKLGMSSVIDTLHTVVLENPYYKSTVDKMLDQQPGTKQALATMRGL